MIAIVGLGNPGNKYILTKHNIGIRVIDQLLNELDCVYNIKKSYYEGFLYNKESEKIKFIKPLVYMNNSGQAIRNLVEEDNIQIEKLLIICDDFNLPLGKLRIRKKGGDGGHKGLASIIEKLGDKNFPRLRCGIGLPQLETATDYVLSPFSQEYKKVVDKMIHTAASAAMDFYKKGIDWTMNYYN